MGSDGIPCWADWPCAGFVGSDTRSFCLAESTTPAIRCCHRPEADPIAGLRSEAACAERRRVEVTDRGAGGSSNETSAAAGSALSGSDEEEWDGSDGLEGWGERGDSDGCDSEGRESSASLDATEPRMGAGAGEGDCAGFGAGDGVAGCGDADVGADVFGFWVAIAGTGAGTGAGGSDTGAGGGNGADSVDDDCDEDGWDAG